MNLNLPDFLMPLFDANMDIIIRVDNNRPLLEITNFTGTQSLILENKSNKWIALDYTGVETQITSLSDILGLCYALAKGMCNIPKKSENFMDHIDPKLLELYDGNFNY